MKPALILLLLLSSAGLFAQSGTMPKETFLNAVAGLVIAGNPHRFSLLLRAAPCSFNKYDYGEWVKYGLKEDVGFLVLNELAQKAAADGSPAVWQQDQLPAAHCIDDSTARNMLTRAGIPGSRRKWRRLQKQLRKGEGLVYSFSKPEFTGDNLYAVIDFSCRCDNLACGLGATFLFRRAGGGWIIAGDLVRWED